MKILEIIAYVQDALNLFVYGHENYIPRSIYTMR